jgi:uncharacterized protein
MEKRLYLADNIHNSIQITTFEKKVISTSAFNRLHNVYQNSTVYLTFPTCRTKRFEHSLGVMELASAAFSYSISNTDVETLSKFTNYSNDLLNEVFHKKLKLKGYSEFVTEISKEFTRESLYNESVRRNDKSGFNILSIIIQSLRFAALLHDLGHPPYSHVVENSLEKLYKQINTFDKNTRVQIFNDIFGVIIGKGSEETSGESRKKLHEEVGFILIDEIIKELIDLKDDKSIYVIFCLEVAKTIIEDDKLFDIQFYSLPSALHSLIDGEIDADRFDYVCRDARNSGFRLENLNYARFYSSFTLRFERIGLAPEKSFMFCPNEKTLDIIDDFFLRKDQLYSRVIYHHRSNKMGVLLGSVVFEIAKLYLEEKIDIGTDLEPRDIKSIPDNISGLWIALIDKKEGTPNTSLIQWDDSWLSNLLKKYYSDDYLKQEENIYLKLVELVSNRKIYNSYIKRVDDFIEVNNGFSNFINSNLDFFRALSGEIDFALKLYNEQERKDEKDVVARFITLRKSLKHITEKNRKRTSDQDNHELLVQWIKVKPGEACKKIMNTCIKRLLSCEIVIDGIHFDNQNTFIAEIDHKEVMKDFYIYLSKDKKITTYQQLSAVPDFLKDQATYNVGFHIYSKNQLDFEQSRRFLFMIGEQLGCYFRQEVKEFCCKNLDKLISPEYSDKIKTEV